jgi:hypothetical protein
MPSLRKLAGLVAAGVRSLERPAALVATRTVRAARGSGQRAVQNVGQLAVNAVSSLVSASSGFVRLRRQPRLRRAQLRPAVAYTIWVLASGLVGAVLVFSVR